MAKKTTATGRAKAARGRWRTGSAGTCAAETPTRTLREALVIPQALTNFFAGAATRHQVALALEMSPTSSAWGRLTGAAGAYGLTKGESTLADRDNRVREKGDCAY